MFSVGQSYTWAMELRIYPAVESEWRDKTWELTDTNGLRVCCWDDEAADSNWASSSNWYHASMDNTAPTVDDYAVVGATGRANPALVIVESSGAVSKRVLVGYNAGATGILCVVDADLSVAEELQVGIEGSGTFSMTGGTVRVTNQCVFGVLPSGNGQCNLSAGSLITDKFIVGDLGVGEVVQSGGTVDVSTEFRLGGASGSGTYRLSGGTLNAPRIQVGYNREGSFIQTGGLLNMPGKNLYIGYYNGSTGTYSMVDGQLLNSVLYVGLTGSSLGGTFIQSGGTNTVQAGVILGRYASAKGTYDLQGGTLLLDGAYIYVGHAGNGILNLGDADAAGTIQETGTGSYLEIQREAGATGILQGWGNVELSSSLQNSGRVIADGYGADRDLDLSTMSLVKANPIANVTSNGWFAVDHGRLILPGFWLGDGTKYWGENSNLDLVNSVSFDLTGSSGQLLGKLIAPDHGSVPTGLVDPVSVWEFTGGIPGSGTLTVRIDDTRVAQLGLSGAQLKLVRYDGAEWQDLTGTYNATDKTLSATDGVAPSGFFAVAGGVSASDSGLVFIVH